MNILCRIKNKYKANSGRSSCRCLLRFQTLQTFTFKLLKDDITGELSLIVTEEIDDEDDAQETISLWNHQISELKRVIGA